MCHDLVLDHGWYGERRRGDGAVAVKTTCSSVDIAERDNMHERDHKGEGDVRVSFPHVGSCGNAKKTDEHSARIQQAPIYFE
jgi:hypothetical protein